jgi:hypothetical protein
MQHQTIVGLFPTRSLAEDVRSRLQAQRIPDSDISLATDRDGAASNEPAVEPKQEEGFWAWLFGSEVSAVIACDPAADRSATDGDQVIPLAKEDLEVRKRQVQRRYRIRRHVIETPVKEQVHFRDEHVLVERQPATGMAAGTEGLQEREFDVVERHEEPVVGKRARATEEVVVRKEP